MTAVGVLEAILTNRDFCNSKTFVLCARIRTRYPASLKTMQYFYINQLSTCQSSFSLS